MNKWSAISTRWQPLIHTKGPKGRAQARPRKRWEQDIVEYLAQALPVAGISWQQVALNEESWGQHHEHFIKYACKNI